MDNDKEKQRRRRSSQSESTEERRKTARPADTSVRRRSSGNADERKRERSSGNADEKKRRRSASSPEAQKRRKLSELPPEERAKIRRQRQIMAAKKRKRQLIIRLITFAVAVIALIIGIVAFQKAAKQKKLEPDGGAGTNALQAAEAANNAEQNPETAPAMPENPTETDSSQQAEAVPTAPPVEEKDTLSICMVGDVILHQRVLDASVRENGYDFSNLFANVTSEVQKYDIKIVNQETILGGPPMEYSGYPSFNSPFEEADALVNAGFNIVLQASNHALDKGQPAVQNCLNYWNNAHPETAVLGIHDPNEPSQDICLFDKNGIIVAILNYTYGTNKYQEEVESGELAGEVNFLDPVVVQNDIQRAKEIADYVIVCPHWGVENEMEYNSEQAFWCQNFLEWGVDLVIGTHPHVIQPVEMLTRSDGHQMLVYYSLGNFLSNQNDRFGNVGAMAQIVIKRNEQGVVVTDNYGVRPLVCHEGYDGESFTTYFLDEYSEDMALNNDVLATDPEFSYTYCQDVSNLIFGGLGKIEV